MKRSAEPVSRRWPLWGFLGGWLLALGDALFFRRLGIRMTLGGREVTPLVMLLFGATFACLGLALGWIALGRQRERQARETIDRQHSALLRSQEELVRQEKLAALGRLLASVAHELRNPLGVIRSAAEVLREDGAARGGKQVRAAELVVEEADRLNATLSALLSLVRPARLRFAELAIGDVVSRAAQLSRAGRRGVPVDIHQVQELPTVQGDVNLLAQAVAGLLDNAADAGDGAGSIELRATRTADGVRIEVADDGPGVDPAAMQRIFEPFFSTKAEGTGLGLSIAQRIAEAHGGRLELVADPSGQGKGGACFRLSLPLSGAAE